MTAWLARLKLAWRDLWAQGRRSVFFALLVAAGVASLVGVQGMARSIEESMHKNARQMLQGDIEVRADRELSPKQQEALDALRWQGASLTEVYQTQGMVVAGKSHIMVELKLVDFSAWPYYGGFRANPADARPGKGEVLVGPELLSRLNVQVGDTITLGSEQVKIAGTVEEEPQIPGASLPLGPRVLTTAETLPGVVEIAQRSVLVKLPDTMSAAQAKEQLSEAFVGGESEIRTHEDAWKSFGEVMSKVFTFLSMVALISLLVGGLGVAMAMRTFISQKLEHIAVLKALGATSGSVMSVFLAEALLLGIGGSLAGVALGMGVQVVLPKLFEGFIPVTGVELNWTAALGGLAAGIGIAVLSALVPVRAVRAIKPVALFRGEATAARMGWRAWLEAIIVGLLTLGGIAWIAISYARSTLVGLGFLGGILAAALLLFLVAWVLLRSLRLLPQSGRPATRHAVRSLHAPGNQSASVVVAMGLGIMLMTTVYLIQSSLIEQVREAGAGPNTPNLYLMGVTAENKQELRQYLERHPQVAKVPETLSIVQGTVQSVDGKTLEELAVAEKNRGPVGISGSPAELPQGMKLFGGEWFTPADHGKPFLTVYHGFAKSMHMEVGSQVVVQVKEELITFTVKSIFGESGTGVTTSTMGMLASAPGAIDPYADTFMLTAVTKPQQEQAVIGDLMDRYPDSMPISLGTMMDLLDSLLTRVANILRFVTAFAVVAAGVILSGSLSATRFRRRKEAALLKSLGASRGTVAAASALENGLLGAVAGLAGGGLGYAMVKGAGLALKMQLGVSLWPLAVCAVAGGLLAVLVSLAATLDVLQVKPLTVLRSE